MTAIAECPMPTGTSDIVITLHNGEVVHVRAVQPDDEARLLEFLESLSTATRRLRFFTAGADLTWFAQQMSHVHVPDDVGLVACVGAHDEIIGHAMYARIAADHVEVALTVADAYQGQGLGTHLLEQLIELAARNGVRVIEADVLPENRRMLAVFRHCGTQLEVRHNPSALHIEFPALVRGGLATEPTDQRSERLPGATSNHLPTGGIAAV